jgi:Ca2+-binding RTX toxin-like protein
MQDAPDGTEQLFVWTEWGNPDTENRVCVVAQDGSGNVLRNESVDHHALASPPIAWDDTYRFTVEGLRYFDSAINLHSPSGVTQLEPPGVMTMVTTVRGWHGVDIIHGSNFGGQYYSETLLGGLGDDWIWGHGGADAITGNEDDDHLYGGDGNDTINGGDENDYIDGGSGIDTINGGDNDDVIFGGLDGDIIDGGDGNDKITGGRGADEIRGGANDDILCGDSYANLDLNNSDDKLYGESGIDCLDAGAGITIGQITDCGGDARDIAVRRKNPLGSSCPKEQVTVPPSWCNENGW